LAKRLAQIAEDRFKTGDVAQLEVIQTGLEFPVLKQTSRLPGSARRFR